jgi:hypothetical protein
LYLVSSSALIIPTKVGLDPNIKTEMVVDFRINELEFGSQIQPISTLTSEFGSQIQPISTLTSEFGSQIPLDNISPVDITVMLFFPDNISCVLDGK